MDILVLSRNSFLGFIYDLPPGLTSYILRVGFMMAFSSAVLYASWSRLPNRSVLGQSCMMVLTVTVSLYTPVDRCRNVGEEFLALSVVIAGCCMIFIPPNLPFLLTPRLGTQRMLKKVFICLVWGGLWLQVMTGR